MVVYLSHFPLDFCVKFDILCMISVLEIITEILPGTGGLGAFTLGKIPLCFPNGLHGILGCESTPLVQILIILVVVRVTHNQNYFIVFVTRCFIFPIDVAPVKM